MGGDHRQHAVAERTKPQRTMNEDGRRKIREDAADRPSLLFLNGLKLSIDRLQL
jgi:hypothetical protein